MPSTATRSTTRRPIPALVFLLLLGVLAAVVWWRVLHRSDTASADKPKPTTTSAASKCIAAAAAAAKLPAPSSVLIRVLNSTSRGGLAAQVSSELRTRGFGNGGSLNAPPPAVTGVAEIRFGVLGQNGAKLVSYQVPGAKLVQTARTSALVDLVVGANFTDLASTADASAAMAKALGC